MQIHLAISISWLQMGPPINTPADLTTAWQTLRLAHPGLPSELRDPQRDALFWLIQGKSIILCIGTGDCSIEVLHSDNIMNFIRKSTRKLTKLLFENLFIGWDVLCLNKELVEYMIWSQAFLGGGANLDFNFAKAQLKSSWSNSPFFLGRKQELSLMILHAIRVDIHDDFWKLVWFHQIGL